MSDRWGPSEDCEICGQPVSFGHLVVCSVCERTMCEWCVNHDHDCYAIYTDYNEDEHENKYDFR
jgi:hypothetical protein